MENKTFISGEVKTSSSKIGYCDNEGLSSLKLLQEIVKKTSLMNCRLIKFRSGMKNWADLLWLYFIFYPISNVFVLYPIVYQSFNSSWLNFFCFEGFESFRGTKFSKF